MIQSSEITHSYSLQMYADSMRKWVYFPTGQLRARSLCPGTTTALVKHHHTADDSISMLYVLKQPQYAVEQYGHALWKHTVLNAALQWHSCIDFTCGQVTVCCPSIRYVSCSNNCMNCNHNTVLPAPVYQQLPHQNNVTVCNDADIPPETIHNHLWRVKWPRVWWGSIASTDTVNLIISITNPQLVVIQLQHDSHSHAACKHILMPLTMTQSHLKCHNYISDIVLSLPLWTAQIGSYLQWHTKLLCICSQPQTFLNTLHIFLHYFPLKQLNFFKTIYVLGQYLEKHDFRYWDFCRSPCLTLHLKETFLLSW